MSKERLKRHLIVVENLLRGAGSVLPFWTSSNSTAEDVTLIEGSVCRTRSARVDKIPDRKICVSALVLIAQEVFPRYRPLYIYDLDQNLLNKDRIRHLGFLNVKR